MDGDGRCFPLTMEMVLVTGAAATDAAAAVAELIVAAFDPDRPPSTRACASFFRRCRKWIARCARYLHIRAAFLLGKILEIDEPKRFKFIDGQHDGSCAVVSADRKKFLRVRELTNLPAFLWSSHMIHLRSLCAGHRFGFSIVELGVGVNCNGLPLPKLSKMGYHFSITIDRRE